MPYFDVCFSDNVLLAKLAAPICNDLTLVQPDGSEISFDETGKNLRVPILGSGHFGVVVRAVDSIGLRRAIKFIDPTRFSSTSGGRDTRTAARRLSRGIADSLQAEIRTTNARLFKHVVPVVGHSQLEDTRGRKVPYAVSPYVDGPLIHVHLKTKLAAAMNNPHPIALNALHDLLLDLVDDLMGALVEMEEGQVSHLDLKPNNIVVQLSAIDHPNVRDQAFVIDFAGAVSHSKQRAGFRVPLMWTENFFPEALHAVCVRDEAGTVDHAVLSEWGPAIDRHCCGRTLEALVIDQSRNQPSLAGTAFSRQEAAKERAWRDVLSDDFDVIAGLIARLKVDSPKGFKSAPEARRAFQAISRHNSTAVLSSRALTDRTRGIVINVGHGSVRVAPPFDRVVNHSAVQRLRVMKQLTLISDVFPGATHSRFTHVVATYGLAKEFLLALNRDSEFRLLCAHQEVEQILAAALLHDLGQYAFSHTIEDLRKLGDLFDVPQLKLIRHDQELVEKYLNIEDGGVSIRMILEGNGLNVDEVIYMIGKTAKKDEVSPAANVGRDIVSGIIDVDRVSYLLQDSKMTGVTFGDSINIQTLVEALCVRTTDTSASLAVREAGVSAVEAVLAAVYWMYKNVYWHPINRGMMASIKHVVWDLLESGEMTFDAYESAVYGRTESEALNFLNSIYTPYSQKRGAYNPIASLADGRRSSVVRVWSLGGKSRHRGEDSGGDDFYKGVFRKLSPQFLMDVVDAVAQALPARMAPRRGEVLIDVPMKKRLLESLAVSPTKYRDTETEVGRREPLWVKLQSRHLPGRWALLEDHTPLVATLADAEDLAARKVRVYFSRELLARWRGESHELWRLVNTAIQESV